jgi:hypothetical protein
MEHKATNEIWWEYHKANPRVFELFKQITFKAINKGKTKLSASLVVNVIRWEHFLETTTQRDGDFKINNNFVPYYARLFMRDFPKYDKIFNTRQLTSSSKSTTS